VRTALREVLAAFAGGGMLAFGALLGLALSLWMRHETATPGYVLGIAVVWLILVLLARRVRL
jgi:hypothetical protein